MKIFFILLMIPGILFAQDKKEFQAYELIIETEVEVDLAAWQAELEFDKSKLTLTAIEGGEKAFASKPDYDSRGMNAGRIILAAFTLKKGEPRKSFKVAELHVFGVGGALEKSKLKLVLAANGKGEKIKAEVFLRKVAKSE